MKKILFTIILCSLSLIMFSQENKNIEISKLVINSFQKNEFTKIFETFDQTMKTALTVEKLKLVWDDLNNKCGKFQKYSDINVDKIQNFDVNYVICNFENMNLKMKVVFNKDNQVAGLFFVPENQK